jgi:hypothetical protein
MPTPGLYGGAMAANPYFNPPGGAAPLTSAGRAGPADPTAEKQWPRVERLRLIATESGLDWPLALRILPPGPETTRLREQIDQVVSEIGRDAAEGHAKPGRFQELNRDLEELRRLWAARGDLLPLSRDAIAEGQHFLRKVQDAAR